MTEAAKPAFECVVSADLFSRALAAISTEASRYYLNGVNVEPCEQGGVLLISTDGKRMLVLRDPDGYAPNGSGIVSLNKDMVRALTAKNWNLPSWLGPLTGKQPKRRFLAVRGQKAAVSVIAANQGDDIDHAALLALTDAPSAAVGGYQWIGSVIDGTFPDWRRVVGTPAASGSVIGSFDASLLTPLAKALVGNGAKTTGVRLVPTEGDTRGEKPVFVFPLFRDGGFAVLMPLRDNGSPAKLPAWMQPVSAMAAE